MTKPKGGSMKIQSSITIGGIVEFPEFTGARVYMQAFLQKDGLPASLRRYQRTVDQMLGGIETVRPIYLMVDESFVPAGTTHRRAGLHVDGFWQPAIYTHHGDGGIPSHHRASGGHHPVAPNTDHHRGPVGVPSHHRGGGRHAAMGCHGHIGFSTEREALILASSHTACIGYTGEYERDFVNDWRGGDCSDLNTRNFRQTRYEANRAYVGDVFTLHESVPVEVDVYRTVVRLNVPLVAS
jgi:hypothetical protein